MHSTPRRHDSIGQRPSSLLLIAAGLWCLALGALADQNDERLDALFERLKTASDAAEARPVAQRIWEIWLDSGQEHINDRMQRGVLQMNIGRLDAALETFTRIVEQAPNFAEGWNKRATVHYLMGNLGKSVEDVERTLALEPRHFGALSGLGLIFLKRGDERAALRAFEAVLEVHPHAAGVRERVERLREELRGKAV